MSIINSIVAGKAKGKVGNVVLTVLKGQSIMKQLNDAPSNPKTPLQVASRGKMSNAVKAWQFLFIFLSAITPLRKSTESNYNAFVRMAKNLFTDVVALTASSAAGLLAGLSVGIGNFCTVNYAEFNGINLTVGFNTGGLPFAADTYLKAMTWNDGDGVNDTVLLLITEAQWLAQTIVLPSDIQMRDYTGSYIFNSGASKCSNICFVPSI